MASYVDANLLKGEVVHYRARCSVWSLVPLIVLGLLTIMFVFGVIFWIQAALLYFSTEMAVTNRRVVAKSGFIRRSTIELNLQRVESIQVSQGLLGRLFDFGTIVVSGAGNPQAPVRGISSPLAFRSAVLVAQEMADKARATS
jgi:uncharacterized membrane protein YdbT with pleckstrin-like domain